MGKVIKFLDKLDNIDASKIQVNEFVNDYLIQKKLIKVRSFGLFHKCMLKHYQNINNESSETASRHCATELTNYMKYKAEVKVPHLNQFYLNADDETIKLGAKMQGTDEAAAVSEFKKVLFEKEIECRQNLSCLKKWLDDWEDRVNKIK